MNSDISSPTTSGDEWAIGVGAALAWKVKYLRINDLVIEGFSLVVDVVVWLLVNLERNGSISGGMVEVVLESRNLPFLDRSRDCFSCVIVSSEVCIEGHPVWSEDSAAVLRTTAVAAVVLFREMDESLAGNDVLVARGASEPVD